MFTDSRSLFSSTTLADPGEVNSMIRDDAMAQPAQNSLDDIFGDDDDTGNAHLENDLSSRRSHDADVSDVPRLRSLHTTNGYRDGITASKEKFLQEGFDEGYSLGAEIGAAAGTIIGILESVVLALTAAEGAKVKQEIADLLSSARKELSRESLYASEYFGEDGIWTYETGEEGSISFRDVAARHPLILKWRIEVERVARNLHLRL